MYNRLLRQQIQPLSPADYWDISSSITRLLTDAENEVAPTLAALQLLATRLAWDVAVFWIVNEIRMVLECSDFYSPTPDRFPDFQTVSRARHFAFGQGLPGSAWQSRTVVHYPELSLAQNFPRLSVAASEHLRTGVAFPLYVGKRVLGVIEMFTAEPRDLAPATQEFLFALGGQIGVFLERFYAGRTLQAADAQFVLLAEAASLAIFTIDDQSNILFANPAVEKVFGYKAEELIGGKLTVVMPEYLRHVHEHGLARYVATGQRHVSWDGVSLPGLHKNGHEIPLVISFGEFVRAGKRVFTGFAKPSDAE